MADFTVYTSNPKGGVRSPASIAIIAIIANAIGSKPTFTAIGEKIAAVSNIIDIESIIIPKANQIKTITAIIAQVAIPESINRLSIALAIPVIANVRE